MKDFCPLCGEPRDDYQCPTCDKAFGMTLFTKEEPCEHCGKPVDDCECYSCCGDLLNQDYKICPSCGEHC